MEGGGGVVDLKSDPRFAGAGDEETVPARFSQVVADVAADVGVDVALGQRRAGHHDGAPRGAHLRALVGAGHEQQRGARMRGRVHAPGDGMLVGRGRFVVGRVPFNEEFGGEGFAAHVLKAPLVGDVPSLAGPGGQIHPKHPSGEAVKAPRVGHGSGLTRTTKKAPQPQAVS